jgi:quinol monooxygenase YgiN
MARAAYTPRMTLAQRVRLLLFTATVVTLLGLNANGQTASPVYVVTHVDVFGANGGVAAANKILLDYAADSKKHAGFVRFEVMVQDGRPNHYTVVEVWQTRAAFEAHTGTAQAKAFREKIQPLLGSPFDERLHSLLQ